MCVHTGCVAHCARVERTNLCRFTRTSQLQYKERDCLCVSCTRVRVYRAREVCQPIAERVCRGFNMCCALRACVPSACLHGSGTVHINIHTHTHIVARKTACLPFRPVVAGEENRALRVQRPRPRYFYEVCSMHHPEGCDTHVPRFCHLQQRYRQRV